MQENINIPDSNITTNLTFRQLVLMNMQQLTNFPYIEKDFDALTDYELLCLVVKYLNDVIANQNEQNDSITRMYESFLALQEYVNNTKDELEDAFNNLDDYVRNYFENLDVQEEINNKLDKMLEDGQLEQIIEQFLQSTALWCFNSVKEMKESSNLINGSFVKTIGYYEKNDGGGAIYNISDEQGIYYEVLNNGLYANIIIENDELNILQIGIIKNDRNKATENTNLINSVINNVKTLIIPSGTYYINDSIIINTNNHNLVGTSTNTCYLIYNGISNVSVLKIGHNVNYISNIKIKNVTFDTYEDSGITNNINAIEFFGNNPSHIIIEECIFRHFKTAILGGRLGHINNLTIKNNNIWTCYNGIDLQYYNGYQVNAIYIHENDISYCDNCGIIMYGNNMVVENNTIQACKNYGISVGENIEHSFNQYCMNSVINNNYFEKNGSTSNDAVILLVAGTKDGSSYYKSIESLSIQNNYFVESIAKLNTISTGHNGEAYIYANNNKAFYIKNANKLGKGSIITAPLTQDRFPYTIEQSNAGALRNSNEFFYNIFNKNYFATNQPFHVDSDKQTSIIIYATQSTTTNINNDIKNALIKANIIGSFGGDYWASNFNFETKTTGTSKPIGSVNYEHSFGINTPIISPIFFGFYNTNKPSGATTGYVHVIKIQGNTQASEFNVYIDMVCNILTARGYKVKIVENENKDIVNSIPTTAPTLDKDYLVYCTEDLHWYGYYGNSWHQL